MKFVGCLPGIGLVIFLADAHARMANRRVENLGSSLVIK